MRRPVHQGRHHDRMDRSREGRRQEPANGTSPATRKPRLRATAASSSRARPTSITPASGQLFAAVEGTRPEPQIGRRSIVTYAALVGARGIAVQTRSSFANRRSGSRSYNAHYLAIQMLEGFVPRDQIKLGRVPNGSPYRFKMLMDGTIDATTLTEPFSLPERRVPAVIAAFHHGTESRVQRVRRRDTAPSTARCARQCGASTPTKRATCTTSSTTTKTKDPRSPS